MRGKKNQYFAEVSKRKYSRWSTSFDWTHSPRYSGKILHLLIKFFIFGYREKAKINHNFILEISLVLIYLKHENLINQLPIAMINVRITSARLNNLCYSLGEGKTTARRTFLVWSYWCDPLALFLPPNSPVQSDPYQFDSSASIPQAQSMDLTLHSFKSGPALLKKKQLHQALDMFFFFFYKKKYYNNHLQ